MFALRGGGPWGAERKIVQKRFFFLRGKRHDNKILKVQILLLLYPKGPFRTKNTTTIAKIVNYYAVVFLLRPPDLLRRRPFSEMENVCNSQENGVSAQGATR